MSSGGSSHERPPVRPDETLDGALAGAVRLVQPRKGYRFSIDGVLLARFAAEKPVDRALDLGCGSGVVALCLLSLRGAREVVGVDLQREMVERAKRSAQWNGLADRCRFLHGDLRRLEDLFRPQSFPLVVSNPPYRPPETGRVSPDRSAALARHELACTLADVVAATAYALAAGGAFCVVYPASRVAALVTACRDAALEPKVLRLVHPRQGEEASLCLLRCVKGAAEGLEARSPLFLHAPGRRYSEEAELLLGPP